MSNFEMEVDNKYAEAINRLYAERGKAALQARLYDTAQAILDNEKPGEEVAEVLINTKSALPLATQLKKFEPKKTVFTLMYYSHLGNHTWESANVDNPNYASMREAGMAMKAQTTLVEGDFYFILQREIPCTTADLPDREES